MCAFIVNNKLNKLYITFIIQINKIINCNILEASIGASIWNANDFEKTREMQLLIVFI